MKNGTMYATRLKKAISAAKQSAGKVEVPEMMDSIRQLAVAVMGVSCAPNEAERRVKQLVETMVDWNEVRVSTPLEVCIACGITASDGLEQATQLIRVLRSIYHKENLVSLDRLKSLGRREARQYLEQIDGIDPYTVAAIVLWSLGGHAIPVNDRLLHVLRDGDLVNPESDRGEIQAFLERHVPANQAKEFCLTMQSYKPKAGGSSSKSKSTDSKKKPKAKKATA